MDATLEGHLKGKRKTYDFFSKRILKYSLGLLRWVKFPHSLILLLNKSVFPMAMYCLYHCFLYPRTECIMLLGTVRKFYHSSVNNSRFFLFKINPLIPEPPVTARAAWGACARDAFPPISPTKQNFFSKLPLLLEDL